MTTVKIQHGSQMLAAPHANSMHKKVVESLRGFDLKGFGMLGAEAIHRSEYILHS